MPGPGRLPLPRKTAVTDRFFASWCVAIRGAFSPLTRTGVVSTEPLLLRYGAAHHSGTSLERGPPERFHTLSSPGVESTGRVNRLYRKFGPAIYSRCRRLLK